MKRYHTFVAANRVKEGDLLTLADDGRVESGKLTWQEALTQRIPPGIVPAGRAEHDAEVGTPIRTLVYGPAEVVL